MTGKSAAYASRMTGGAGSVIGGAVMLRLDRQALTRLRDGLHLCVVSGTNGKTTTATMLSAVLALRGPVASNATGANLLPGIASALASDSRARTAVLEVDEAVLPSALRQLTPEMTILLNLSRDQLDRYGEVRATAESWADALSAVDTHVVANADDPLVVWSASWASSVCWVAAGATWTDDATTCPSCAGRILHDTDGWHCTACPLRRPPTSFRLLGDELRSADGLAQRLSLKLPGRCNLANAALAIAAATATGIDPVSAALRLRRVEEVGGRYRTMMVGGVRTRLLLAKNPAGWLETLDFLQPPPVPVVIVVNARAPDGRDPSWLWDVPFERLAGRRVVVAGERALDVAVRLRYAEVAHRMFDGDPADAIRLLPAGNADVVANYTAFRHLARAAPRSQWTTRLASALAPCRRRTLLAKAP